MAKEYKDTLNLPETTFPMKANLAIQEPIRLGQWNKIGLYEKIRAKKEGKPKRVLPDGPPYANGKIHMGHAVNKVIKDMIVKSWSMSGYDAAFIPGWDCHGLPIELNVEKKCGKVGEKISAAEFRQECRDYALSQIDLQRDAFIRLGVLGDWHKPYATMDFDFEANVVRSIHKIAQNGHLIKGFKPVYWCVNCASALALAEVEYADKQSDSIYVRFKAVDDNAFLKAFKLEGAASGSGTISAVIWTTTPWTLPANQAVALGSDLEYALVQLGTNERILLAVDLIEGVMQAASISDYKVLGTCVGSDLLNLKVKHPIYNREVPLILGAHVTLDAGTGLVHTAPSHGPDDYVVGKKYHLPLECPVLGNGTFSQDVEFFAGEHVYKVNPKIVAKLEELGTLLYATTLTHSYPNCWRHKTPLIFRATPQWFISMEESGLRDLALAEIKKVKWVPDWGQSRIEGMVKDAPDWCISRQRTWGSPIPLFLHKVTGEVHPKMFELTEKIAQAYEMHGIEAWHTLKLEDYIKDHADYEKSTDTMDVWFDSGVVHSAVLKVHENLHFPAELYFEGSDQHRGWFMSSLLTSCAMNGVAPYKQVVTHGFVVDAQGRKMSKSLGNIIEPQKVIDAHGVDVMRLWVSTTDYRGEMNVSDDIFKRSAEMFRRLRNTARFLLSNLNDFSEDNLVESEKLLSLDKWAISKTVELQKHILEAYEQFQFHHVSHLIQQFCVNDLGGFYLDIIKDRQYTCQPDSLPRRSAQTAMYFILEALVRWLAPIVPFTAEEIWEAMPGKRDESIHLQTWYDDFPEINLEYDLDMESWSKIILLRDEVNKSIETKRNQKLIGSGLEAEVSLFVSPEWAFLLSKLEDELRFIFITSYATVFSLSGNEDEIARSDETSLEGVKILVEKSKHEKCIRCWHRREDVGSDVEHPDLCARCIINIDGKGEDRFYA